MLVVVQRYGDGVSGGAEAHARMLVNKLRDHFEIEVATTTALDYWTWKNELTAGTQWVDGIPVHRFPVAKQRARGFHGYERRAFSGSHSLADEIAFLDAQGPVTPDLREYLFTKGRDFDHVLFFTYIYWTTVFGLPLVPERAVLVPTAHDEPAIGLSMYRRVFHLPRAIAYNTLEERAMVQRRFADQRVPSDVVGVGIDAPSSARPDRFRQNYGIDGPFFLYLGRIVESKGVDTLLEMWSRWRDAGSARTPARPPTRTPATLVLAGSQEMPLPERDDVRFIGRIDDDAKWDAYAACTAALVPEALQSLSLVALEAWSMGTPVVCPASSNVLASMSRRAGAGLPYRTSADFAEICELLLEKADLRDRLGRSGSAFVARTYTWPVVVEKYLDIFAEVRTRNSRLS